MNNKGGVKTDAGKEISKYNAQTHGVLRETLEKSEIEAFDILFGELSNDLKPVGCTLELMVEMMTSNVIRLKRISTAESIFMDMYSDGSKWSSLIIIAIHLMMVSYVLSLSNNR